MKRQASKTIEDFDCDNKKQKLQTETSIIDFPRSSLENLSNEIFYDIFEYLDMYDVYKGFYHLNNRFKSLLIHSNLPIRIHISTISISNCNDYVDHILIRNRNRISLIHLSNPFAAEVIFSPPRTILKFPYLQTLILENIATKYLDKLFLSLVYLPNLHSLIISIGDYVGSLILIFSRLFSLSKLRYLKISYEVKMNDWLVPPFLTQYNRCRIHYLIINGPFPYDGLHDLLCCLPQLRHLSIKTLVNKYPLFDTDRLVAIKLKYLKYVSLELDSIPFDGFQEIVRDFFYYIKTLRFTTSYNKEYLNAKQWQELIVSSMPYLQKFDFHYDGAVKTDDLTLHDVIDQFNSRFWIEKQWFFTHEHTWPNELDSGDFFSTNPYRRKNFMINWGIDQRECSHAQVSQLNSVEHVYICSREINNEYLHYFPNAKQLTITYHLKTTDVSILVILDRMMCLKQLNTLIIDDYSFPFVQIIELLRVTSNLHTLKLKYLSMRGIDYKAIQKSKDYQFILNTNKIHYLSIAHCDSYEIIQWITNLFPKLQYFQTGIRRKEIIPIVRYLLTKPKNNLANLFFLCITGLPKVCLKEVKALIKSEKLLDNYFIKFVNRDLYLWW